MTENLSDWIGRSETVTDTLDLRPAQLMQSVWPTPDRFEIGSPLPPLWCWLYFHQPAPLDQLGRDGHPRKGGFLPPVPLPRRMWAGGRFEFHGDLRIGEAITRRSTLLDVAPKQGKSGPLCFVTVEHRYQRDTRTVWREEHDIVYRADPAPDQPTPKPVRAPANPAYRETVTPSPVMLFRYSALTFNGHRIHYDRPYARAVEGYPELVFHGPLAATLLADLCRRSGGARMRAFEYRAVAPLFDTQPFDICWRKGAAWAQTHENTLAMQAAARFE